MTADDASRAGFDHRAIKSLIIRSFGAAFDQLRPVSGLHFGWDMFGQPVDTPARGEMDAPVDAIPNRMPVLPKLKINQLQPIVSDQTIIWTRIVMKICQEWARFGQVPGYASQFLINSQSRLDSNNLRYVAEQCGKPFAPIVRRIAYARPQSASDTLELGLLACCERVHSAQCRREHDQHGLGISRIGAEQSLVETFARAQVFERD